MKICHQYKQPVVTQGGLTGLAGGACLLGGEIVISLERMTGIEDIDPISATMTVLMGTHLQTVQEEADKAGFLFPLDLGARGSCTIGGNLATNAGGNRVIKYGMTRDLVLDLEAVMADGSIVGGTHQMIKNNTGYDIRNLLIGSEGTLAIITRAVLKLSPKPKAVSTAFCGLPNYESVTTLLSLAQENLPSGVSAFEVMWPGYYDFVLKTLPNLRKPLNERHAYYVLLESTGANPLMQNEALEKFLGDMLETGTLNDAAIAMSQSDTLDFWDIRDAPAEYGRHLPGRVSFDVSFAISDVGKAAHRCETALREKWPNATILIYGHLGDGNIHIQVHESNWPLNTAAEVQELVYNITGEMNGSVSAEHGIGTKRKHVLGLTRTPAELSVMKAIKVALDPNNILNPGKVFDLDDVN
jgi:FAD/FMN-containing dehydrogenase